MLSPGMSMEVRGYKWRKTKFSIQLEKERKHIVENNEPKITDS